MNPFEQFKHDYQNKKVLILGLGIQGRGVGDAKIMAQVGAQLHISDLKTADQLAPSLEQLENYDIKYTLGQHLHQDIDQSDVILRNASVPWNCEILEYARSQRKTIVTDESLFFRYARPKKVIGITGTRGKSTTTQLIYQILKSNNYPTILAGNLSPQPALGLLESFDPNNWYVFELSSWQLQGLDQEKISPHIAILTNIYPDHLLDRDFEAYANDKAAIFRHQTSQDYLITNPANPIIKELVENCPSQIHWFDLDQARKVDTDLLGEHNLENIAAALKLCEVMSVKDPYAAIKNFKGLPYRLETIGYIKGVRIINDTTSTTPTATIKALETFPQSTLIVGGTTKKLPVGELIQTINSLARKVIFLSGSGTEEIKPYINSELVSGEYDSLTQAIELGIELTETGNTLLFSPGFTSFGMFQNEFDRGDKFNQIIKQLLHEA